MPAVLPILLAAGALRTAPCPTAQPLTVTTLCLINHVRAEHGARELRLDPRLRRAAERHSLDMVAHQYFAHDSLSGASFGSRLLGAGWMRGRRRWTVGENLAWGTGPRAAPAFVVAAWLRSPPSSPRHAAPRASGSSGSASRVARRRLPSFAGRDVHGRLRILSHADAGSALSSARDVDPELREHRAIPPATQQFISKSRAIVTRARAISARD